MTVKEVIRSGPFARWLYNRDWRAVTLPTLSGNIKIRYWVVKDPNVAFHEWRLHVNQIRKLGRLGYLRTYLRLWIAGYRVARKFMELSRKEAAQFAYEIHPMEQVDWESNV